MNSTFKKALMFIGIGLVLVLVYFFVIKKDEPVGNLVSSGTNLPVSNIPVNTAANNITVLDSEFSKQTLSILSNVKTINLDDSIFSSLAFQSLIDGTIPLVPDNNEGRPNPFAPIGVDNFSTFNSINLNSFTPPAFDLGLNNPINSFTPPVSIEMQNLETLTTN